MKLRILWIAAAFLCLTFQRAHAGDAAATAKEILNATDVQGGIVVHIGCGDGKLTAALHANGSFTVHGIDSDPANIERAREYIRTLGVYGPVSVERLEGPLLPYVDNLTNLVVVEDPGLAPMREILRVLVPDGVACVRSPVGWMKIDKPRPGDIDEWSHFLHDAGNNAVSHDERVGPPRTLQWVAPPLWLRSHETPSGFQAQVTAGGRLFYFFDDGLIGITDERLPDRWSLVCRDAFNGRLLWKQPIEPWGWREWAREKWEGQDWTVVRAGRVALPDQNQRRLVADSDRLYATLGYDAPLSILDARNGEPLTTVEGTEGTNEILASDGIVIAYVTNAPPDAAQRRGKTATKPSELVAVRGRTGKELWRKPVGGMRGLSLAIDQGRVVWLAGQNLTALDIHTGEPLWREEVKGKNTRTLVAHGGIVVLKGGNWLESHDGKTGHLLWHKKAAGDSGAGSADLFVADGLVWTGMIPVDEKLEPAKKSTTAMAIGFDPQTGEEKRRVVAPDLRSVEHHHRCYRNKATDRYIISGMEGAEFMDLRSNGHSQNNWVRGACKLGIMPCNGMLYAPPDQCFCSPGSKLLGYTAIGPEPARRRPEIPDDTRLSKGPAYNAIQNPKSKTQNATAWPTFRHDPARSGSTRADVPRQVQQAWRRNLGGPLTAPVAVNGKVFVSAVDSHTLYALNARTGEPDWTFIAGGRIDSPPTIHNGLVLFGAKDGRVYCLRETDGALAWRFMAAPSDRRIACFDQIESAWPVHGSILVADGIAYFTAGRSTYLDGGIRVYGLDPATGKILHKGLIEGPHPEKEGRPDHSFYTEGANSDVLVAEGGSVYMRQKRMTPDLKEIEPKILSIKGEMDVGLHVFSTSGLLDGSWYNRTFWMYSKRWPGFQLANQAPKTGQVLVVDDEMTYALRVFYRRNVHSPMFFPGKEGYLLFADRNDNEPQIVGEDGAREPVEWLPQSDYSRGGGRGIRTLDSEAFGLDKMIGYTRAEAPVWARWLPVRVRAMVKTDDLLFVAGPPDEFDPKDPFASFEGRCGAQLITLSAADGEPVSEVALDTTPIFDGMIAADERLFVSFEDGSIAAFAGR